MLGQHVACRSDDDPPDRNHMFHSVVSQLEPSERTEDKHRVDAAQIASAAKCLRRAGEVDMRYR